MKRPIHTETLPSGFSFDMIHVQGGSFMMGSDRTKKGDYWREDPTHSVRLDAFWIGKFPVTQALWKAVMGQDQHPSFFQGDDRPVETVSWDDCQQFLEKLNISGTEIYRLPTEAEWEYAARGGSLKEGYGYAGSNKLKEVGWVRENSDGETKAVGRKQPNGLGIYDMCGNVWEWCADWYDSDYYEKCLEEGMIDNPLGPDHGGHRVLRGGSWFFDSESCRSTDRYGNNPGNRSYYIGFRLVFSPSQGYPVFL